MLLLAGRSLSDVGSESRPSLCRDETEPVDARSKPSSVGTRRSSQAKASGEVLDSRAEEQRFLRRGDRTYLPLARGSATRLAPRGTTPRQRRERSEQTLSSDPRREGRRRGSREGRREGHRLTWRERESDTEMKLYKMGQDGWSAFSDLSCM